MNREIKFRVWDKKLSEWCGADNFAVDKGGEIIIDFDGGWDSPIDQTRFILMQYTGLLDKNGKEIYEGDIVKVIRPLFDYGPDDTPTQEILVEIKWVEATAGFRDATAVTDGEVIGNIYENPELLK